MAVLLGYAELYRFTGDDQYLGAAMKGWENIRSDHTLVTGGPWSYKSHDNKNRECFARIEYFDPTNSVENCSTVTWVQLSLELLRLTGEARYAAEAERAVLNHLFGAQSPNGTSWAYFTPANCPRRPYNDVLHCCGSSGPRALEMYARHLVGNDQQALTLNTYLPLSAELDGGIPSLQGIEISGGYPFEDRATLALDLSGEAEFPVDFFVPDGVGSIRVIVDGQPQTLERTAAGYQRLRRAWSPGEEIAVECDFSLTAHYQAGRDDGSWVAFKHGPLALAQEHEEGADLETLDLGDTRPEADELLEVVDATYRIRGTKIELMPYYLAGSTGQAVRTLFPVTD
jgi:DUF1680 family protein